MEIMGTFSLAARKERYERYKASVRVRMRRTVQRATTVCIRAVRAVRPGSPPHVRFTSGDDRFVP